MYRAARVGRLFVCCWAKAEIQDLTPMMAEMKAMKAERGRIHYVAVIGADIPVPDTETRRAMTRYVRDQLPTLADRSFVVIEGDGILPRLNRTVVRGMAVLTNQKVAVFSTLQELIRSLGDEAGDSSTAILSAVAAARAQLTI